MTPERRRTIEEGRQWLLERLERRASPLNSIDPEAAREAIGALPGLDPEPWTATWCARAEDYAVAARRAEERGDRAAAREAWRQAYEFSFVGRYPCPSHPLKEESYARAREYFVRAAAYDDPPLEPVTVPFAGRDGEGSEVRVYVSRPAADGPVPVVLMWGGIDTWKEEAYSRGRPLREAGVAVVVMDMPGVGEAPVRAGRDAERQWTPVFDWIAARDDLDETRCAVWGLSFGGYWAMKLAHTHAHRLAAAVNWGGGVHITFQPEWQERSRHASSYLMDLMAARARIFGGSTFADYVARCPELSLLDQGLLDEPCAPLLLVNGRHDLQNATDDIYLSLEHGDVKSVRIFPGGHMGEGPVLPTCVAWLRERLRA